MPWYLDLIMKFIRPHRAEGVVRLAGEDATLRAIAREAVGTLGADSGHYPALWALHRRRRRFIASSAWRPAPQPQPAERRTVRLTRAYRAVWGTVLGAGLLAALVLVLQFDAEHRKNRFVSAEQAVTLAQIAAPIALVALGIGLLLRVPGVVDAEVVEVLASLVGLLALGMLVFRFGVGAGDGRGFTEDDVAWWIPVSALVLLLLIGIVVRCDVARRRANPWKPPRGSAGAGHRVLRELRRTAARLAGIDIDTEQAIEWSARLDVLDKRGIDADAVAQAREMTPIAWLAWMSYDGELEISGVVPRSSRDG